MCVIHATVTNGVHNMNEYRITLLSDFLYGARAIAYALLAASDPSLLSAIKDLISRDSFTFNSQRSTMRFNVSDSSHSSSKASHENRRIHIELSTIHHYDDGGTLPQTPHADKLHDGSRVGFISLPVSDHKYTPDARIEQSQESTLSDPDIIEDSDERQIQEQDAFRRQI
ncbi:hypothetical protein VKT23_017945 [Stygiomarasmius scandens]|uniref:Uncharacterized protein n=1 Tax=Marasmiellus scandens TaxID=2682957 RepID=A0ABR1IU07_9AGAR